ncbi:MAG TPA: hypothetical protein VNZ58_01585 [Thermomicrobiales bacterium]|nr:hypothetical protein [Thermomicrobiales bacterium]
MALQGRLEPYTKPPRPLRVLRAALQVQLVDPVAVAINALDRVLTPGLEQLRTSEPQLFERGPPFGLEVP